LIRSYRHRTNASKPSLLHPGPPSVSLTARVVLVRPCAGSVRTGAPAPVSRPGGCGEHPSAPVAQAPAPPLSTCSSSPPSRTMALARKFAWSGNSRLAPPSSARRRSRSPRGSKYRVGSMPSRRPLTYLAAMLILNDLERHGAHHHVRRIVKPEPESSAVFSSGYSAHT
jgi:hypothetical protein